MPFSTSIQYLEGAHSGGGSGETCAVDWQRKRAWLGSTGTYLTRIGLVSGLEEAYQTWSTYGGQTSPTGLDFAGNLYFPASGLHNGGQLQVDGNSLGLLTSSIYPVNVFGGGGFANVSHGGNQYILDTGLGGSIIGTLSEINVTLNTSNLFEQNWPVSQKGSLVCGGLPESTYGFLVNTPTDGTTTQSITLSQVKVTSPQSVTVIGSVAAATVDAGWTSILAVGICLDKTDGNPIVAVTGATGSSGAYVMKLNAGSGAIIWKTALGSGPAIGTEWNLSSIAHQTLYIITPSNFGSPPVTVNTINTSTGVNTTYTSNLAGLIIYGGQMSNDDLGCIVVHCGFTATTGSPTRLNSTPSSWTENWAALYVGPVPSPPTGRRKSIGFLGLARVLQPVNDRVTEAGDLRVTEAGDQRITQP